MGYRTLCSTTLSISMVLGLCHSLGLFSSPSTISSPPLVEDGVASRQVLGLLKCRCAPECVRVPGQIGANDFSAAWSCSCGLIVHLGFARLYCSVSPSCLEWALRSSRRDVRLLLHVRLSSFFGIHFSFPFYPLFLFPVFISPVSVLPAFRLFPPVLFLSLLF